MMNHKLRVLGLLLVLSRQAMSQQLDETTAQTDQQLLSTDGDHEDSLPVPDAITNILEETPSAKSPMIQITSHHQGGGGGEGEGEGEGVTGQKDVAAESGSGKIDGDIAGDPHHVNHAADRGIGKRGAWGASSSQEAAAPTAGDELEPDSKKQEKGDEEEIKRPWGLDDANESGEQLANAHFNNSSEDVDALVTKDLSKRMWGTSSAENATKMKSEEHQSSEGAPSSRAPFPKPMLRKDSQSPSQHPPPDGFAIKARVYIDKSDKLAHLNTDLPLIPYWDCGVAGSTTSALPLKNAYFRHALSGSTNWADTDGQHAVLMVALNDCRLELNSGEALELAPGDVVLLEDVLKPGHQVKPLEHEEIRVLFLTLPQRYYQTGKENLSLPSTFVTPSTKRDPCPSDPGIASELAAAGKKIKLPGNDLLQSRWSAKQTRRICLGIFGLSVSTLAADFLGKTAPLWLAVGIGGTGFVAAVTWATILGGDALLIQLDVFLEKRKLNSSTYEGVQHDIESTAQ